MSVIPRFIPTCSQHLLEGLGQLAQQEGLVVHSHISESRSGVEAGMQQMNSLSFSKPARSPAPCAISPKSTVICGAVFAVWASVFGCLQTFKTVNITLHMVRHSLHCWRQGAYEGLADAFNVPVVMYVAVLPSCPAGTRLSSASSCTRAPSMTQPSTTLRVCSHHDPFLHMAPSSQPAHCS